MTGFEKFGHLFGMYACLYELLKAEVKCQFTTLLPAGSYQTSQSDAMSSSMDLFNRMQSQEALRDTQYQTWTAPECLIDPESQVFTFNINSQYNQYWSLSRTELRLLFDVVYDNDIRRPVPSSTEVGFIADLGNTMWRSMEVAFNDKVIPFMANTHVGLVEYVQKKNSFSPHVIAGPMAAQRITYNTPGNYDRIGVQALPGTENASYLASKNIITAGEFEIICKPPGDIFHCEKLLPPATKLTVVYTRHPDSYVLMHPNLPKKVTVPAGPGTPTGTTKEIDGPRGIK